MLITNAKTVFSEHSKSYKQEIALDINTLTKDQEVTMHCQIKASKNL